MNWLWKKIVPVTNVFRVTGMLVVLLFLLIPTFFWKFKNSYFFLIFDQFRLKFLINPYFFVFPMNCAGNGVVKEALDMDSAARSPLLHRLAGTEHERSPSKSSPLRFQESTWRWCHWTSLFDQVNQVMHNPCQVQVWHLLPAMSSAFDLTWVMKLSK